MPELGANSHQQPLSEINVTPFVDVMLVMLIIFMVTAPLMHEGIDVDLPETTTQPLRMRDEPLILSVNKQGEYFLGRTAVAEPELGNVCIVLTDSTPKAEWPTTTGVAPTVPSASHSGAERTALSSSASTLSLHSALSLRQS